MDFGALYTTKTGQNTRRTAVFSMTFHSHLAGCSPDHVKILNENGIQLRSTPSLNTLIGK